MKKILLLILLALSGGCIGTKAEETQASAPPAVTSVNGFIQGVDYSNVKYEQASRIDPDAIRAVWADAQVTGDKISIPEGIVRKYKIVDFEVRIGSQVVPLMAIETFKGEIKVMPRICVPCRSTRWHLKNDVLICDACGTTFRADTGGGISGACVNFPKALIPYTIENGKITMGVSDIEEAYENTLKPGLP